VIIILVKINYIRTSGYYKIARMLVLVFLFQNYLKKIYPKNYPKPQKILVKSGFMALFRRGSNPPLATLTLALVVRVFY
jgi:hypothetical protein